MAVDALPTVFLETLRDLLVEEVRFLSGVSDQVKQAERDLKTMHSLLMDADKWRSKGYNCSTLQNCIANLKKLAFEAENVLEKYAFEVTSNEEGSNLKKKLKRFACILSECFSVHQVGKEIDDIRSRFSNLTERLGSISRGEGPSNLAEDEQLRYLSRLKYAHELENHFVGMEKDIECLVSMVKDDRRRSPVISISGMGGLGKTTLARKIYHHEEVRASFQARAWVCVTQKFGAKSVLSRILKQLVDDEKEKNSNEMEADELVVKINGMLMERKSLIVVDDIWEKDHWNILKPAFPRNCKVVLTTRNENIVSQDCVYKLDLLSKDQGWELLQKIAILDDDDAQVLETRSRSLEDIGRQMVQKCGRLPLAISVIGGILRQKQTFAEWENVSSNIDSYLKHGEGVSNDKGVKQVLDLSYDVLPYYLKPCFLYLGSFSEDAKIEPLRLYLLWISEGLISSEDRGSNETLMDVAERYLTELAFRCMVQVQKNEIYIRCGKFESCRLHDLIHDLCSSKAEEENFFKRVDPNKRPHDISSSTDHTSTNRIAINFDNVATTLSVSSIQNTKDLISFLVLRQDQYFWDTIYFRDGTINFDKSKCLRILHLEGCKFDGEKLPSRIDKLIHLRYLSLNRSFVEELPPAVCKMPYLQTLDLRVSNSIKLPNVIHKMKRLKHLYLNTFEVIGRGKLMLDGLNELETLEEISSNEVHVTDICKLTNLRKLVIEVDDVDSLSMIAHQMRKNDQCHTHLSIRSCSFSSEEDTNVLTNMLMSPSLVELSIYGCEISCGFPCYQQGMCKNLVKFTLSNSKIGGDVMESLGKYPALQALDLIGEEPVKAELIFGPNSFPELKSLQMNNLPNLMKWQVEERAMPRLTKLEIGECLNLEMIPDGLRFISSLREFESRMPKEFNDRLRVDVDGQQGEDYNKVSHIPSIELDDMSDVDRLEDEETMA